MDASTAHIVFSGGGTGGHLFPGLAVAGELAKLVPQLRVTFVGRGSVFERDQIAQAGYEFVGIAARPLPRRPWEAVGFLANHLACRRDASKLLRDGDVSLVVGLGGYASVPVARAATASGIPLVILEQNAVAGRANHWLASGASLVCAAMETEQPWKCACPVKVVGNPVRRDFAQVEARADDESARLRRLIVLGGSQGARSLNDQAPKALYKLGPIARDWQIVHQSGERDLSATRELYRKLGLKAHVTAFVQDLPKVLARTDLAISRAGGTTLAELAASGVPAVLAPYPHATRNHQRKNADAYAQAGAARVVDVRELDGRLDDQLVEELRPLIAGDDVRHGMAAAMRSLARPNAAREVAELIGEMLPTTTLRRAG